MTARVYKVIITGKTPLLMHHDNIDWADKMEAWKNNPGNKKTGIAGDDRTPAWRWIGCLYHDGMHLAIPAENLARAMMEGGAMVPVPGGRSGKTFKAQSQSGMLIVEESWPLYIDEKTIPVAALQKLTESEDFALHRETCSALGFALMTKRARIGQAKHVRVRPRFDRWQLSGSIAVVDTQITKEVLQDILTYAGEYKGLGDWRPGSRTPGAYGMFEAKVD